MALPAPLAALGVAVVLAVPLSSFLRYHRRDARDLDWPLIRRGLALNVALVLGVVLAVVGVTGSTAGVGLVVPSVDAVVDGFLYGFIAFGVVMLLVGLLAKFAGGITADPASLVLFEQPLYRRVGAGVVGATVEAVLFYGVAIQSVLALGGGEWIAGGVAAAGLLVIRARWNAAHALQWVPGAVILSAIALRAGTAVPVLLVRLLYDVITYASGDVDDYAPTTPVEEGDG